MTHISESMLVTVVLGEKLKPPPHSDCAPQAPSWECEPEPQEGWTIEDQQALAAAARANHKERTLMLGRGLTEDEAHWQFLRLLARHVPGKSAAECGRCLKHVKAKRIAYFGPPLRSASTSPIRSFPLPPRAESSEPPPPPRPL